MDNRTDTLLDLYFSNEISEKEAAELKGLLHNDPEAAAEWKWRQQISRTTRQMKLETSASPTATVVQMPVWRSFSRLAAGLVFVVAAAGLLFYITNRQPDVQEAVAAQFEPYPNNMPFRALDPTAAAEYPAEVIRAFQLYDDPAKLAEAAEALGAIAAKYPDHPEYAMYHGVSLVGLQKYAEAITTLQPISNSTTKYHTPALYYLGLAHSGNRQYVEARQVFERYIKDKDGVPYRKKAQEMLNILPK